MEPATTAMPMVFPIRVPFRHKRPETVWGILMSHGFSRKSGSPNAKSEKWTRDGDGGTFIVRLDKQGHDTDEQATGRKAHGGRPHYHKEWKRGRTIAWYRDGGDFGGLSGPAGGAMTDGIARENHIPR